MQSNANQCQATPRRAKQCQATPSNAEQRQAMPSNAKQRKAIPSNAKQRQAMRPCNRKLSPSWDRAGCTLKTELPTRLAHPACRGRQAPRRPVLPEDPASRLRRMPAYRGRQIPRTPGGPWGSRIASSTKCTHTAAARSQGHPVIPKWPAPRL